MAASSLKKPEWPEEVLQHLAARNSPGHGSYWAISRAGISALGGHLNIAPKEALIHALHEGVWPLRFAANRGVLSAADQARLLGSKVAVIGCGGLGGAVIILLARLGVGSIVVCDGDVFDESNLNRQWLCREDRLGRNKADCAREELAHIASHVKVFCVPEMAGPDNLDQMLAGVDLVVDCLDNVETRKMLEAVAHRLGLCMVHGALAGFEGMVGISRPEDPLLPKMYKQAIDKNKSAETKAGVPTVTPAAIASLEVFLALNELLGRPWHEGICHLDFAEPLLEILNF